MQGDGLGIRAALKRRLSIRLIVMATVLALSAGTATAQAFVAPPSDATLGLTLSTPRLGYVSATLTGPAHTSVSLTESDSLGLATLKTVTLPATGKLTIAELLVDSCSVRVRTVTATAPADTDTLAPSASVTTPACTTRLDPAIPTRGRMGHSVTVTLGDRWRVGGLPVHVCVQPPGGASRCVTDEIAAGQARRTLKLSLPRIGGWQVTASIPGGRTHETVVWASHPGPIRMLALGDSEMQVLDDDLAQDLAPYDVQVVSNARPSTGLSNSFLYNWQTAARQMVATHRPDISVVSMGANDGYSLGGVECCGPDWSVAYGGQVAMMARTLLQGQAGTAYWFVLATPQPADFQHTFDAVNAGIEDASHTLAGRMGLINANAYFTPGNVYRNYMTVNGHGFTIHESDGIHLNATADQYAAILVVKQLLADREIH
jgi:hypothetical protein